MEEKNMTSRQFKTEKFEEFKTELQEYARSKPYCPIYETDVRLNDEKYTLFIQPDRNNRMYILYALWVGADKETGAAAYEMITKGRYSVLAHGDDRVSGTCQTVRLTKGNCRR